MKYLVRIALVLAIVAVSLVTFTFAASIEAGNGTTTATLACHGGDVKGTAAIDPPASALQLANQTKECKSGMQRHSDGPISYPAPDSLNPWHVTMTVSPTSGSPTDTCLFDVTALPARLVCHSSSNPIAAVLSIR